MSDYGQFLASKHIRPEYAGFDVEPEQLNKHLFKFQRDIIRWSLKLGRAALFEERGLGKTIQQLAWSEQVCRQRAGNRVLIAAPLVVTDQTVQEGLKIGVELKYVREQSDVGDAEIVITNYERLRNFDLSQFTGIVLDESSILKAYSGVTKRFILEAFKNTRYKLACTATPAPNDTLELGNHAEFLGVMPSNEMIARFFINNTMKAGNYRLKKHAEADFWRWVTSWSVCISHPRDLGDEYDMPGYDLPAMRVLEHLVETADETIERTWREGMLLPDSTPSSTKLHKVKRESLSKRIEAAEAILSGIPADEPVVIWCDTNYEADALMAAFPDAVEVRGSHKLERKEEALRAFTRGEAKRIITKPDIAGMGLNWQHCNRQVFIGPSYSFEQTYQAIGRSHRFGQTRPVDVHMIYSPSEAGVLTSFKHKADEFRTMQRGASEAIRKYSLFREEAALKLNAVTGNMPMIIPSWLYSKGA